MQIDVWSDLTGPETLHMQDQLEDAAEATGLSDELQVVWHSFEQDRSPGPRNTFDAHRCVHLARERGVERPVWEALARAAADRAPLGEHDVLVPLVTQAGLDETDVREMLDGDGSGYGVRVDEATAAMAEIRTTPAIVFGQKYVLTGVQPYETVVAALERAWHERGVAPEARTGGGCGGDGEGGCGGACMCGR